LKSNVRYEIRKNLTSCRLLERRMELICDFVNEGCRQLLAIRADSNDFDRPFSHWESLSRRRQIRQYLLNRISHVLGHQIEARKTCCVTNLIVRSIYTQSVSCLKKCFMDQIELAEALWPAAAPDHLKHLMAAVPFQTWLYSCLPSRELFQLLTSKFVSSTKDSDTRFPG